MEEVLKALQSYGGAIGGAVSLLLLVSYRMLRAEMAAAIRDAADGAARKSTVDELDARMQRAESEIALLRARMDTLSTREDVHQLEVQMTSLQGDSRVTTEVVRRVEGMLQTMHRYMMESGR
jgi:hypothetical protein